MDPLGALGFAGTLLTLIDFTLRFSHHLEKVKLELEQQQSEYDVIRLVLQEAVNAVVSDGSPTQAIQSAMLLCAKLDKDLEREFQRVLFLLEKHDHKRMLRLVRVFSRRNDRRFAYEAFRDSVLLLRDLSYSLQTSRQLGAVRSDLCDIQEISVDQEPKGIQDWDPAEYQRTTGVNLNDITLSDPITSIKRPLVKSLAGSNYTFDATLSLTREGKIRYVPIRGLWDTGSDAFIITRSILERAEIAEEDLDHINDVPTIHGIAGARYNPTRSVKLTWHVNRNMNSRQDTFYVLDEANFDILVPYTLSIGARSTGESGEGQQALVLRLRRKKSDEVAIEKSEEEISRAKANELKKVRQEQERQKREIELKEREDARNK